MRKGGHTFPEHLLGSCSLDRWILRSVSVDACSLGRFMALEVSIDSSAGEGALLKVLKLCFLPPRGVEAKSISVSTGCKHRRQVLSCAGDF